MEKIGLTVKTEKGVEIVYVDHCADIKDLHPVAVVEGALCPETFCLWCRELRRLVNGEREY